MDAREAWKACGEPRGESGVQNIRKRGLMKRLMNVHVIYTPKNSEQICHELLDEIVDEVFDLCKKK